MRSLAMGQFLASLTELSAKELFSLAVVAALVTTAGNLFATFLKEFVLARSFENWKSRQNLAAVYRRYRDPLLLSTHELVNRIGELLDGNTGEFLDAQLLDIRPERMIVNSAEDEYYLRYKLLSTIYRLCAWLGWLELYRRDITFLDSGHHHTNVEFESLLRGLRSALADGHLNIAEDWDRWSDYLIFREEQRAIGEVMIDVRRDSVIGYGTFCDQFLSEDSPSRKWIGVAANFFFNIHDAADHKKDFQRARLLLFAKRGMALVQCLDGRQVNKRHKKLAVKIDRELKNFEFFTGEK
jgi:hypothetical protein